MDQTITAQPWSTESPPFTPPHIHVDDTEDLVSVESQSVHDPDEFRTSDSEDEESRDISNPYRKVRWNDNEPQPTEPQDDPEAEPEEECPTSAFHDSPTQPQEAPTPTRTP